MTSNENTAKVYDINDILLFSKTIINDSVEKLSHMMSDGIEFEKQKENMQRTIYELKEYKRALRKNVASLMSENERIKLDYENQLKKKDSKIVFLNDSITTLETLLCDKTKDLRKLQEELDSYEIISEQLCDSNIDEVVQDAENIEDDYDNESDYNIDVNNDTCKIISICINMSVIIVLVYILFYKILNNNSVVSL